MKRRHFTLQIQIWYKLQIILQGIRSCGYLQKANRIVNVHLTVCRKERKEREIKTSNFYCTEKKKC